ITLFSDLASLESLASYFLYGDRAHRDLHSFPTRRSSDLGVAGSELRIDRPNKRAYKSMPEHVTHMEKSLKGKIVLEHMDDHSKELLKNFLIEFNEDMWKNSTEDLKKQLN